MSKDFAFVSSSFEYTRGVLPLAQRLEAHGYRVHWISFRGYERDWLLENGVAQSRILDTLGTFDPQRMRAEEVQHELDRLDGGGTPYVNDIILMDRLLRLKRDGFAYAYLAHLHRAINHFLQERDIRFVSAGRDTALQIVCAKICARLGIVSVVPTAIRLPDDRFGFCVGHTEAAFVRFQHAGEAERAQARAFLRLFRETRPVPHNVFVERRHNSFLRRLPQDIELYTAFFTRGLHDRGNDYTRYSLKKLFGMYLRRRFNAVHLAVAPPYEPLGSKPFVIYAYHMQPESTVDVLASYFSDQPAVIEQIARSLPSDHELYVKPHQDHVGGLGRRQLLALKHIPGVRLVAPFESSHELMLRSKAIVTLTGTMSFQGALHGVPSIIFAPQFFGSLPGVHRCASPLELPAILAKVLAGDRGDHDAEIVEFLALQIANSFVGRVSPYVDPFSEAEIGTLIRAYDAAYVKLVAPAAAPALAAG
jgi:hypothetical protein